MSIRAFVFLAGIVESSIIILVQIVIQFVGFLITFGVECHRSSFIFETPITNELKKCNRRHRNNTAMDCGGISRRLWWISCNWMTAAIKKVLQLNAN